MSVDVEEIVNAVLSIYEPSTSNDQRMRFTQFVETVKDGAPDVLAMIGFQLLTRSHAILRQTGWIFVEEVIRYKWNDISGEFRLELRSKVLEALEARPIEEFSTETNAKCVVAMMEHEWPQNWPEFVPQLDQLSQKSAAHCTLVFSILRRLVENVVTIATVPNAHRRRDMYNGIVLYVPEIIKMSLDRLEQCGTDEMSTLAIRSIIEWLAEVCEWVPSTALEPHLNRMVDTVVRHLVTAEKNIYEIAAKCLAALAVRKKEKPDVSHTVGVFFRTEVIDAILTTTSMAAEVAHSSVDHYNYLKALCELLTSLGGSLAKVWTESSAPENYQKYLSAIAAFFTHPSLTLKLEACEALNTLCAHPVLGADQALHATIEAVLESVPAAMEKIGYPTEQPSTAGSHYSQMDFDDDVEWCNVFLRFRDRLRALLLNSLQGHLPQLMRILSRWVFERVISQPLSVSSKEWQPMQRFAKIVLQAAFDKELLGEALRDELTIVGDQLVNTMMEINDWNVLNEMLSVHSSLFPTFKHHPTGLFRYVALLQKCLLHSGGHKDLNRHCITEVLRIVGLFQDFFRVNAKLIVDLVNQVRNTISHMQLANLLPALAALSNVVEREEEKIELLRLSVSPSLEYFSQNESKFNDIQSFIALNGFDKPSSTNDSNAAVLRRKELRRHLVALEGILLHVEESSPLGRGAELPKLYPVFFKLHFVVVRMNSQEASFAINSDFRDICSITLSEKQQIYCSVGESMEAQVGRQSPEATDIHKQFLLDVGSHAIHILGMCASKFSDSFFGHPQTGLLLAATVQKDRLECIPAYRLRPWMKKFCRVVLLSCPESKRSLVGPFFASFANYANDRLLEMWKTVSTVDYDAEPTESELFQEHLTCDLAREYISLLRAIFLSDEVNVNNGDEKGTPSLSSLGHFLFKEEFGLSPTINTLFAALTWRDTKSCISAVPLCKAFAQKLASVYDNQVAVFMFVSSIQSLQIHGSDEVALSPLLGLIFHIYLTLRKFSDSLRAVLEQVPDVTTEMLQNLDQKIHAMLNGEDTLPDKQRREMMKKMFRSVISITSGEQHRRPVYLRPLPPIERRRRETPNDGEDYYDFSAIFGAA